MVIGEVRRGESGLIVLYMRLGWVLFGLIESLIYDYDLFVNLVFSIYVLRCVIELS